MAEQADQITHGFELHRYSITPNRERRPLDICGAQQPVTTTDLLSVTQKRRRERERKDLFSGNRNSFLFLAAQNWSNGLRKEYNTSLRPRPGSGARFELLNWITNRCDAKSEMIQGIDGCHDVSSHLWIMEASDILRWTTHTLSVGKIDFAQQSRKFFTLQACHMTLIQTKALLTKVSHNDTKALKTRHRLY